MGVDGGGMMVYVATDGIMGRISLNSDRQLLYQLCEIPALHYQAG